MTTTTRKPATLTACGTTGRYARDGREYCACGSIANPAGYCCERGTPIAVPIDLDATWLCEWYALCDHEAVGVVEHPVLGAVPTCERCAAKHDLEVIR